MAFLGAQQVQHQTISTALPAILQIGKNIVLPQIQIGRLAKVKCAWKQAKINRARRVFANSK